MPAVLPTHMAAVAEIMDRVRDLFPRHDLQFTVAFKFLNKYDVEIELIGHRKVDGGIASVHRVLTRDSFLALRKESAIVGTVLERLVRDMVKELYPEISRIEFCTGPRYWHWSDKRLSEEPIGR